MCWLEGAFMTPQHFQQQNRFTQYLAGQYYELMNPVCFGFTSLEIDVELLKSGKFCIRYARGILPDNTPFLLDEPLTTTPPPATSDAVVTLVLPVTREGCSVIGDSTQHRYRFYSQDLVDCVIPDAPVAHVDMARPNFQLNFSGKSTEGYVGLNVARISHFDGNGAIQLDSSFIPSAINLHISRVVMDKVEQLFGRINQMASAVAFRLDSGKKFKSEYSLLQDRLWSMCFSQWQARLAVLMSRPHLFPHELYHELFSMAGGLSGLTGCEIPTPKALHPDLLGDVLPEIFEQLINAMDVVSRDSVMEVPLDHSAFQMERILAAAIPTALDANVQCVLSFEIPGADSGWLMANIPRFVTVAPQHRIQSLLKAAISGLKLKPLAMPPIELCLPNCQTFVIDLSDPLIKDCTHLALHFDKQLGDPNVRLFMIQTA
ncbi:type VI secretion system baseplate subunit TssK [Endozoicomonas atrinae]|uniref:type VI secretion system baseplate subunit TssK n=1 Tax=Endozoicomonas atrinae TaxID=1333660 RepID=UPI00237818FA|nr:type VI secretion system baseplate subunit TssK [Endozoicomonas atrinae]